jgi:large subunit ribosomal protein L21e
MVRRKEIRTRGKFSFKRYFQKFQEGDSVAVVKERSLFPNFPERLQGRTGVVEGKRGRSYIVKIKDQNKPKQYIIEPIHLKKIKQAEKKQ